MKRVLFLGQKWVGQRCFDQILARQNEITICGCVTNASPNVWWKENKIWESAHQYGIPCIDNNKRHSKAILDLIQKEKINTILSTQHPWILPKEVLATVKGRAFNIHNAPLPHYQGHNACNHAILNGESKFCSTLHWMTDIVDAGAIVKEEWFSVDLEDTARSLYFKGIAAAEKLFAFLLDNLIKDVSLPKQKMEGRPVFYPRNSIEILRHVENLRDSDLLDRKSRAFYFPPFEPAYCFKDNKKHYLFPKGTDPYAY